MCSMSCVLQCVRKHGVVHVMCIAMCYEARCAPCHVSYNVLGSMVCSMSCVLQCVRKHGVLHVMCIAMC